MPPLPPVAPTGGTEVDRWMACAEHDEDAYSGSDHLGRDYFGCVHSGLMIRFFPRLFDLPEELIHTEDVCVKWGPPPDEDCLEWEEQTTYDRLPNAERPELRDIHVIVDGINLDPNTPRTMHAYTFDASDTIDISHSLGYDAVLVSYVDSTADLTTNADALRIVLEMIYGNDRADGFERKRLALTGLSLGGIVARMAVDGLAATGADVVGLYISGDSPHRGASIPLGLQFMIRDLDQILSVAPDLNAVEPFDTMLSAPAPRQMLRQYVQPNSFNSGIDGSVLTTAPPDPSFGTLQASLNGFSAGTRAVALSNGSGFGDPQTGYGTGDDYYGINAAEFRAKFGWGDGIADARVRLTLRDDAVVPGLYRNVYTRAKKVSWYYLFWKLKVAPDARLALDGAPGGFINSYGLVSTALANLDEAEWNLLDTDRHNFVPTYSALDVFVGAGMAPPYNTAFYAPGWDPDLLSRTTANRVVYAPTNTFHVLGDFPEAPGQDHLYPSDYETFRGAGTQIVAAVVDELRAFAWKGTQTVTGDFTGANPGPEVLEIDAATQEWALRPLLSSEAPLAEGDGILGGAWNPAAGDEFYAADVDGDGCDELLAFSREFGRLQMMDFRDVPMDFTYRWGATATVGDTGAPLSGNTELAFGDLTADGVDEMFVVTNFGDRSNAKILGGWTDADGFDVEWENVAGSDAEFSRAVGDRRANSTLDEWVITAMDQYTITNGVLVTTNAFAVILNEDEDSAFTDDMQAWDPNAGVIQMVHALTPSGSLQTQ